MLRGVRRILFLDLDGTLIKGKDELGHFITGPHEVELYDGVYNLIKDYKSKGWRIVIVTNQGGVATGHITSSTVGRIISETVRLLGNMVDKVMICTHHPDSDNEGDRSCFCRKPLPGMLYMAMLDLGEEHMDDIYQPEGCLMVGDMESDKQCADNMGIPFEWSKSWRKELESATQDGR